MKKSSKLMMRDGDTLVISETIVETRNAVVDYEDVLDATEVVYDEYNADCPYKSGDDYDHKVCEVTHEGQLDSFSCYDDHIVILDRKYFDETYMFYREHGASKQVARELAAQSYRKITEQIVEWRSTGWEWYGVKCDFEGFVESVWAIDDYDYAYKEVRKEVAAEVVELLEEAGYTVINQPTEAVCLNGKHWTREDQRRMYRRNIHLFDRD